VESAVFSAAASSGRWQREHSPTATVATARMTSPRVPTSTSTPSASRAKVCPRSARAVDGVSASARPGATRAWRRPPRLLRRSARPTTGPRACRGGGSARVQRRGRPPRPASSSSADPASGPRPAEPRNLQAASPSGRESDPCWAFTILSRLATRSVHANPCKNTGKMTRMSDGRRASFFIRVVQDRRGQISGVIERVATGAKEAFMSR
jgi:hypothetical protein